MTIHYIHHSCYAVETPGALLVFDYWLDSADGALRRLIDTLCADGSRQLYFLVSHFHQDHFNPAILDQPGARLLLSYDTVRRRRIDPGRAAAVLRPGQSYEDPCLRLTACRSTDVGVSYFVGLPDGESLYHAGDNNNWYFPPQPSEAEDPTKKIHCSLREMEGLFQASLRDVRSALAAHQADMKEKGIPVAGGLTAACFPVDPRLEGEAGRGPRQFLKQIPTQDFYPMHCWERYDEVAVTVKELELDFPQTVFHLPHPAALE